MPLGEQHFLDEDVEPEDVHVDAPFPRFKAGEVEVIYSDPLTVFEIVPNKVIVDGQLLYHKRSFSFNHSKEVVRKYAKICQAGGSQEKLLLPRLYGVVVDKRGVISGQLYYWLDIKQNMDWKLMETSSKALREKWASQVQQTLSFRHSIGVVWGDVKAENVVIDSDGNAIVIDLEGGITGGWVDREHMETKEGDVQGLARLLVYMFVQTSPLRSREKEGDLKYPPIDEPDKG